VPLGLAVFGMFPDPVDIGCKRIAQPIDPVCKLRVIVEENEVEPRQRLRHQLVVHSLEDDRREAFVERGRESDLLGADLRGNCIGTEHKYNGVGPSNQSLDALPPILEGINLRAVDQRLETTLFEGGFEPIRESHILARIRDEDLGLRSFPAATGRNLARH